MSGVAVGDRARRPTASNCSSAPRTSTCCERVNPKLEQVVDFGWMAFLAKPLFLIVNWVNNSLVHNFGWAIVMVTIVINFILFPLKLCNMKSMRKMQALQPQIDAINDKYKNVGMRDPKKAEQNQEVMELYKKHGVNPMGGCVPMLLQIPVLLRVLQGVHRVAWKCAAPTGCGCTIFRSPSTLRHPHPAASS